MQTSAWLILLFPLAGTVVNGLGYRVLPGKTVGWIGTAAILGSGLKALSSDGPTVGAAFGTPAQIGELLLTKFLLPFEVASFLLLIAAVGAVVLARRRGGVGEEAEALAVTDFTRPLTTGTMAEAVGGRSSREPFELGVGGGEQ